MGDSLDRFFVLLERVPRLADSGIWSKTAGSFDCDLYENALGYLSSGEAHMARFFAALWQGQNGSSSYYLFDVVEAAAVIDPEWREIIRDWLADPFWP